MAILNLYVPNIRAWKRVERKPIELRSDTDTPTIRDGDFSSISQQLIEQLDITISKDVEKISTTKNQHEKGPWRRTGMWKMPPNGNRSPWSISPAPSEWAVSLPLSVCRPSPCWAGRGQRAPRPKILRAHSVFALLYPHSADAALHPCGLCLRHWPCLASGARPSGLTSRGCAYVFLRALTHASELDILK